MKKILITGANSFVGTSFENWASKWPDKYSVDSVDMIDGSWKEKDFSEYQVVFHVAAIVHSKEKPQMEGLYMNINRDLPIEVAKIAREAGVAQFIFMSTMAVYGQDSKIGKEVVITRDTKPNPKTYYGKSKIEAEYELNKLSNKFFRVVILRPPMIYGPNCPGNYARLDKFASKTPIFPMIENKRSMLHIDSLCKFIQEYIDSEDEGLFFPQDAEYVNTSLLVKKLAEQNGKKIYMSKSAGRIIKLIGKRIDSVSKVFGNLVYDK